MTSSERPENLVEGATWELAAVGEKILATAHNAFNTIRWGISGLIPGLSDARNAMYVPEEMYHAGVIFYGHLYEYTTDGVHKTEASSSEDPGSVCEVKHLVGRKKLGISSKSDIDFDTWVADQKWGRFSSENYDVATNNCVHFAMEATKFLSVGNPSEWEKMRKYTEEHPEICKAGLVMASVTKRE